METLRPFRTQLDERAKRVPFHVLRDAYQRAYDTWKDNADQPETVRDYWPTCVEMALIDHDLLDPEDAQLC